MKYLLSLFLVTATLSANAQVKLVSLNELEQRLSKGKDTTYVINFWATWCGPCVGELSQFESLKKEYFKTPVKVILVSMDFKSKLKSNVIPFVKKQKLKSEVYVINEPNTQAFIDNVDKKWSGALPATLIVKNNSRSFFEKEFVNTELEDLVKNIAHEDYKP
ncbi:redoxin domain-containing protein [Pedobacter sp. LMG 31464]|uniref:Redoxin domain-containing protein n=1 Tax=Pedobacter planticolens TaxID=2679964 RepID=A0A923DY01_9SPHI|nr:TlpA disulfide reductase family protein [Pedobacter planticolens]MBB2144725.1 redoxin domain-containing protein [Pedobacter planticolens]